MSNERITLEMNVLESVMALSGWNRGAAVVCGRLIKEGNQIDPESPFGGLGYLLLLDTFGIYEDRIWMLYKDVCREKLDTMVAVLLACQFGHITKSALQTAVDNRGQGINLDEVRATVVRENPGFKLSEEESA